MYFSGFLRERSITMKKFVSILAAGALLATLLAGCGSNSGSSSAAVDSSAPESSSASEPASESTASGTGLKFGLGLVTELSGTDATADKDGKGEAAVTAAGVLLDAEGKVLSCYIDVMDASMPFTAEGAMNIAEGTEFASKQALGADYGMVGASGIGKEWNEQADAFAAWAVGKTAEEIAAGVGEGGKATDADLAAGCTVGASAFVEAMDKAIANAKDCTASETDTVRLAMVADASSSKDAADGKDGAAQADVTVSAVALNAEGVVTASALDVVEAKITFDATGVVTSDLAAPTTKQELGADYGMVGASGIGKEWFEQADAFAAWAVGKTADEIAAGVGEDGKAVDADLAAGCTVGASAFVAAAVAAATVA